MKNLIVVFLIAFSVFAGDFQDGWRQGYKDGYCYQQFGCLSPIVPLPPLPRVNEDTYRDGYNRGFLAGLSAR